MGAALQIREVQASDAKARLSELLDDVERGETVVITRHGHAIARLVPEKSLRGARIDAALARIRSRRVGRGTVTVEELIAMRDEGRRV